MPEVSGALVICQQDATPARQLQQSPSSAQADIHASIFSGALHTVWLGKI
jgi:hypothetical protein